MLLADIFVAAVCEQSALHTRAWRHAPPLVTRPTLAWGACGAALLVRTLDLPMEAALLFRPWPPLRAPLLYGWFLRLSGVYLTMLPLAFAQISWAIVFQWMTSRAAATARPARLAPNGHPAGPAFYWLALGICALDASRCRLLFFAAGLWYRRSSRDSALQGRCHRHRRAPHSVDGIRDRRAVCWSGRSAVCLSKGGVAPDATCRSPNRWDAPVMVLLGGEVNTGRPPWWRGRFTWLYRHRGTQHRILAR